MKKFIEKIFSPLMNGAYTVKQLALSFSLGAYLAFSPFLGLQTWLVFPLCWISGLSISVCMASLYLIGNPFTLIPIVVSEYIFGKWLVLTIFNNDLSQYNPVWLDAFLNFLAKYIIDLEKHLGSKLCFWCFVIGANVLGILIGIIIYPLIKYFFAKLITNKQNISHENNHSK